MLLGTKTKKNKLSSMFGGEGCFGGVTSLEEFDALLWDPGMDSFVGGESEGGMGREGGGHY